MMIGPSNSVKEIYLIDKDSAQEENGATWYQFNSQTDGLGIIYATLEDLETFSNPIEIKYAKGFYKCGDSYL